MTRASVIINPLSGHGRHAHQIDAHAALARAVLGRHGIDVRVRPTTGPGDARRFAAEAAEARCDLVVAWGGDGTVNEAASALVHTRVPLAIVPAGSGNGLAWDLGLPFEPAAALTIAATGESFVIDAGQVGESWFFNIAGIGIDAVIAARFNERGMRQRGAIGYLKVGLAELTRYRAETYVLSIDGARTERRAMLISFANGRQYGNRVCIAPGARLDDGLLEMVVADQMSLPAIALRLPSVFAGTLKPGRGVTMTAVREVEVASSRPLPFHVDGEPHVGPESLVIRAHRAALCVRVGQRPTC